MRRNSLPDVPGRDAAPGLWQQGPGSAVKLTLTPAVPDPCGSAKRFRGDRRGLNEYSSVPLYSIAENMPNASLHFNLAVNIFFAKLLFEHHLLGITSHVTE